MKSKEIFKYVTAGIFVISLVTGFFLDKIPSEIFVGVAGSVVTYIVANRKYKNEIEELKSKNARIVDLDEN